MADPNNLAAIANVQIGPVTFGDDGSLFDNSDRVGILADYMVYNHYEQDGHTYFASLTSPEPFNGSTVGIFRVGNPTLLWICEWTACRIGDHPLIPDPAPPSGWILLDVQTSLAPVTLGPDGYSPVYRISGLYAYVRAAPSADLRDDARYPLMPWVKDGFTRKIPLSALDAGIKSSEGGGGVAGFVAPDKPQQADQGQGLLGPKNFVPRG